MTTKVSKSNEPRLNRQHFETSRLLDFLSRKELIAQTGHQLREWPLVAVKELIDNALDACEEQGIAPEIAITVDDEGITVQDNGPGIPPSVVESVLDFAVRVSSREAYVSPCRGAQGNALKTLVAMPFVLSGGGKVIVEAKGVRHVIAIRVDRVRQIPLIEHQQHPCDSRPGTKITVEWPTDSARFIGNDTNEILQVEADDEEESTDSAGFILRAAKERFLQIAESYVWLNPHLSLTLNWGDDHQEFKSSNPEWRKWLPSNPTDPHWYTVDELERLIAANIRHDGQKTVREFVSEFRGLSGTAKQREVLDATGLSRAAIAELVVGDEIDRAAVERLLAAMKAESKPVKPDALGVVGRDHLLARCVAAGGDPKSFEYKKVINKGEGLPWVLETCFAYCPEEEHGRRIITGVNWSPGIINPFRQLGAFGKSLDSVLENQRVGRNEPTVFVLHIACPKVSYADRGKSSVIIEK